MRRPWIIVLVGALAIAGGLVLRHHWSLVEIAAYRLAHLSSRTGDSVQLIKNPRTVADRIVNGAKTEAINCVLYDASYAAIPYPNGDVASNRGACTDVVVRALRNAGYDLQKLIHKDMTAHFDLYPHKWGHSRPDANIDHRRMPNQMVFFKRFGTELPKSITGHALKTWKPGDIVCWDLGAGHTGIVSNEKSDRGVPLVIHNNGMACEEDCLDSWPIIGHFRYPKR